HLLDEVHLAHRTRRCEQHRAQPVPVQRGPDDTAGRWALGAHGTMLTPEGLLLPADALNIFSAFRWVWGGGPRHSDPTRRCRRRARAPGRRTRGSRPVDGDRPTEDAGAPAGGTRLPL